MKKTLILTIVLGGVCSAALAGQQTGCIIEGRNIVQNGREIGRYNGEYIVRLPELRGVGKRDGEYIVRLSDKKEVCRQDDEYVVKTDTGETLGKGDAAAVCLCAGLLY